MRLSIVVPVYNVEKYLERCIRSLLAQDIPHSDYEIRIVNDGTKDGSLAIAEKLAAENPNVFVTSQANKGLSGARNTGLREVRGTYVWFVDSDDSIQAICLSNLLETMEKQQLDTCHIGFSHVFNNGSVRSYLPPEGSDVEVLDGKSFFTRFHTVPTAWSFVHRTAFLRENDLWFYEGIVHEDEEFLPRMLFACQRITSLRKELYVYYENAASIMGTRNLKSDLDKCRVLDSFRDFLAENQVSDAFRNQLNYRAFVLFQTVLHPAGFFRLSKEDQVRLQARLKDTAFYPIPAIEGLNAKFKLYRALMNLNLSWYPQIRKRIG